MQVADYEMFLDQQRPSLFQLTSSVPPQHNNLTNSATNTSQLTLHSIASCCLRDRGRGAARRTLHPASSDDPQACQLHYGLRCVGANSFKKANRRGQPWVSTFGLSRFLTTSQRDLCLPPQHHVFCTSGKSACDSFRAYSSC